MTSKKNVLLVGLEPHLINFSDPAYAAFPGLTAEKVLGSLNADAAELNELGYDTTLCLVDFGETAEAVLSSQLKSKSFDCGLVGAGVRKIEPNFLLFEKLINIIHQHGPQARICFNTNPADTAEAVQRWI
jgi:hypothetical protein